MTEEAVKAFLEELSALTRKHRIEIGGCGCCGSPSLTKVRDDQVEGYRYALSGGDPWWSELTWTAESEGNG